MWTDAHVRTPSVPSRYKSSLTARKEEGRLASCLVSSCPTISSGGGLLEPPAADISIFVFTALSLSLFPLPKTPQPARGGLWSVATGDLTPICAHSDSTNRRTDGGGLSFIQQAVIDAVRTNERTNALNRPTDRPTGHISPIAGQTRLTQSNHVYVYYSWLPFSLSASIAKYNPSILKPSLSLTHSLTHSFLPAIERHKTMRSLAIAS